MQNKKMLFYERLRSGKEQFHPVVSFNPNKDTLAHLDCTENNKDLAEIDLTNTKLFSEYIDQVRKKNNARYLIGGYNENRMLYKRSHLFDLPTVKDSNVHMNDLPIEPRTLHLGTDIWGAEGTEIYAPIGGRVHSFAFNDHFGDYGATLILLHQLDGLLFYSLYGHLSLKDLGGLTEGKFMNKGELIAHFGAANENGHWPPHLHFQLILDINNFKGDYPGVCTLKEKKFYLENSPDPDVILNLNKYLIASH